MGKRRVLDKMAEIHKTGYYCFAACLRDILEYYGHKLSFPVAFGLLGGVCFYYARHDLQFPGIAPFMWCAGDPGLDPTENLTKALNIYHDTGIDPDPDEGWDRVCGFIDRGQPVMIDVVFKNDYVKYLNIPDFIKQNLTSIQPTSVFSRQHTGGQRGIVFGYDETKDVAYQLEPLVAAANEIPVPVLKELRTDTNCYFPPHGKWSVFYIPQGELPLARAMASSIALTAHKMFNPPDFGPMNMTVGLPALKQFAADIAHWPEMFDAEVVRDSLQALYVVAWSIGRGQFRGYYARFLRECKVVLEDSKFDEVADVYAQLARLWEKIGKLALVSAGDPSMGLTGTDDADAKTRTELLSQILPLETEGAGLLQETATRHRGW